MSIFRLNYKKTKQIFWKKETMVSLMSSKMMTGGLVWLFIILEKDSMESNTFTEFILSRFVKHYAKTQHKQSFNVLSGATNIKPFCPAIHALEVQY